MEVPEEFEEGFNMKVVLGALFIAFVMLPGSIYLDLVAGTRLGGAAPWVTVILFVEVARRSFVTMRRQEIYLLVMIAGVVLGSNPFQGFFWNVYMRTGAMTEGLGIAAQLPDWYAPDKNSAAVVQRTFLHRDWWILREGLRWLPGPALIVLFGMVLGQLKAFTAGYVLFRVTSDHERLPFPFAGIGAQGATALAEISQRQETWRWRMFSIGAMIGLAYGFFYVGIPTLTGSVMSRPLQLIPIPFFDLTHNTEHILPATPTGIGTDLGALLAGFVIPFWSVVGSLAAAVITIIANPVLHHYGQLQQWHPGMDTIQTQVANSYDFWTSARVGMVVAIAIIGVLTALSALVRERRRRAAAEGPADGQDRDRAPPATRGDFSIYLMLGLYSGAVFAYAGLCKWLGLPTTFAWFALAFGFIYTPISSYIDARMIGMVGQPIQIPFVREITYLLYSKKTGYRDVDIWVAPIPVADYGQQAMNFRVYELTGTRFPGVLKTQFLGMGVAAVANLVVCQFLWKLAPIPSYLYPFAQKMWPMQAYEQGIWWTATSKNRQQLFEVLKAPLIIFWMLFTLVTYGGLYLLQLPYFLIYGFIQAMGTLPHFVFPQFIGACIGRFYFMKRMDASIWRRNATVLLAGYGTGFGLVGMAGSAIAMIAKSVSQLPY